MNSWRVMFAGGITKWANPLLIAFGSASFLLYRVSLRAKGGDDIDWFIKVAVCQSIIYLLSAWIILHARSSRSTLVIVIAFAALFRLSILFSAPYLSDDIYRYIWDGRTQAAGINPYQYIPADKALAPLRDETIYPKINRREYAHTIYRPGAEMVYFLATRVSERVTWMKTVMVGFEVFAIWGLLQLLASFNLSGQRVLIFAWHPLLVWEIAGSGHVEAAAIAFIVLALLARRRRWDSVTGAALAGATLIKLFPIILLPAMYRRWGWKTPATFVLIITIAYLPYFGVGAKAVLGFLPAYTWEEGLQSGAQFYLLGLARRLLSEDSMPTTFYLIKRFGSGNYIHCLTRATLSLVLCLARSFYVLAAATTSFLLNDGLLCPLQLVAPRRPRSTSASRYHHLSAGRSALLDSFFQAPGKKASAARRTIAFSK